MKLHYHNLRYGPFAACGMGPLVNLTTVGHTVTCKMCLSVQAPKKGDKEGPFTLVSVADVKRYPKKPARDRVTRGEDILQISRKDLLQFLSDIAAKSEMSWSFLYGNKIRGYQD
jgi:hypothetical protein